MGEEINIVINNLCEKLGIGIEQVPKLIPEIAEMQIKLSTLLYIK